MNSFKLISFGILVLFLGVGLSLRLSKQAEHEIAKTETTAEKQKTESGAMEGIIEDIDTKLPRIVSENYFLPLWPIVLALTINGLFVVYYVKRINKRAK